MEDRETVLKALEAGKKLISSVTGLQYMLIGDQLHVRQRESNQWNPSGLTFESPQSWLNLQVSP